MIGMLKSIWNHTSRRERLVFYLLLLLMFIAANLELLGIGLLLPVVALLTNPELIHQNRFLELVYRLLQPSSTRSFLFQLCFLILLVYLLKNGFLAFMTWFQTKVIYKKIYRMASSLFRTYVFAPYSMYLTRNTSELISRLGVIRGQYNGVLISLLMMLTEVLNVLMIFAVFFFFVPWMTLLLLLLSAMVSLLIYYPLRWLNNHLGRELFLRQEALNRNDLQVFNGIKEIRILGAESLFIRRSNAAMEDVNRIRVQMNLFAQLPRFLLEVTMVAGVMILLSIYLIRGVASTSIILKISLIGAGMVRLMPALSRVHYHFVNMRHYLFSLDQINQDMDSIPKEENLTSSGSEPILFRRELVLDRISFQYEKSGQKIFDRFSLTVPVNSSVALIGRTGCGKTTLGDLIAGLLPPDSGRILADGRDIRENLRSWRSMIGYVPQFIYLLDDTILANITLGIPEEQIDIQRVREVLRLAQLEDFITSLPLGLNTIVGERGTRLSGGQRQRIGIARALYSRPRILILDEATSALDNETEQAFIDAIAGLHGNLTMFVIAHRLSTIRGCSMVIDLTKKI